MLQLYKPRKNRISIRKEKKSLNLTDTIVMARQCEACDGHLFTYLSAAGILSKYISDKHSLKMNVVLADGMIQLYASSYLNNPVTANAQNSEVLIVPAKVFTDETIDSLQKVLASSSQIDHKDYQSKRVNDTLMSYKEIMSAINSADCDKFSITRGGNTNVKGDLFDSIKMHFEMVDISLHEALDLLEKRIREEVRT
jgi:hypothetical protein